jgi:hypothetical protein
MKKEINLLAAIVLMIVIAGVAFYGGMSFQKSQTAKTRTAAMSRFTGGAGRTGGVLGAGGANINRPVSGQVLSVSDTGITVKMANGTSRIVMIGDSTVVAKSTPGAKTDLTTGQQVMVSGTANSDGSLTAQNIQIQPTPAGQ